MTGSAPSFPFYPADWIRDTRLLSPAAKGVWADTLCAMHWSRPRGRMTSSMVGWARLWGTTVDHAGELLNELVTHTICDSETRDDGNVTLVNRRMAREEAAKESARSRVERFRKKRSGNAPVTESNSLPSSSGAPEPSAPPPRNTPPLASREAPRGGSRGLGEDAGGPPDRGLSPDELIRAWNANCGGMAVAQPPMSAERRRRLRTFARKRPELTLEEFGAVVKALGEDPWACGKTPRRNTPLTIDGLLDGDAFERQREKLASTPRRLSASPARASSRPQKWEELDHQSMTAGDEPSTSGAGVGEKSG